MHKIEFNLLKLREALKLLFNPIYALYAKCLTLLGIVNFPVPPNSNMRRTSAKSLWRYWYSGLTTSLPINVHAQTAGIDSSDKNEILDFGCGVGGQIRMIQKYFPNSKISGCDVDPSSIRWLTKNYPDISFVTSKALRALKYKSNHFDLVYSVSTFSHFSADASKFYMKELSRVTKENGVLILTIEGLNALQTVADEWNINKKNISAFLESEGSFHVTYEWIKKRINTDYSPISDAVDITTYFDKDYGSTIFSDEYFIKLAQNENLKFVNKSLGTCCDRQDIYVFKKVLTSGSTN